MNHMRWLSAAILCCLFVSLPVTAAVEVTYCFGKVELLRAESQEWEFLKKGTALDASDRLRTPPISILRLATSEGTALPIFTGTREVTVAALVQDGFSKLEQLRHLREQPLQDEVAIDVLPIGAQVQQVEERMPTEEPLRVSVQAFESMRAQLAQVPDTLRQQALAWRADVQGPDYASESMRIALDFYGRYFGDKTGPIAAADVVRYTQLLIAADLRVALLRSEMGDIGLHFDTELLPEAATRLTVNRQLTELQDNHLWLPLQIGRLPGSFTSAWYHGAKTFHATGKAK